MKIVTVDLTHQPKGCTEHPLIRLKNTIRDINKNIVIRVITDNNVIPLSTIKIIAKRMNLHMEVIKETPPIYEVILKQ